MKSCNPQALSCILRQLFYWGFFSFGLRDVVNLSTTFFIQRFFTFFIFFIKTPFFNVFYSWGQRFLHLWLKPRIKTLKTSYLENKNLKTLLIKNVDDKYIKLFKP